MKIRTLILLVGVCWGTTTMAQTWTTYNTRNSKIIGDNVLALATDKQNGLWVGTTEGLCQYKNQSWTDYAQFNEKLKNQFVNCLIVEGNRLWIGTDDYGVIEFTVGRWTEHNEETRRMNMKYIRDIAVDHAGVKWIGVTLSGLVEYDGVNWNKYTTHANELLSDFILCVAIDQRDRKWIGTNDGLCVYDGRKWTSYTTQNSPLPHNITLAVAIDHNNVKWIGTLDGLCRLDGENWKIFQKENSPLPGSQINDLTIDDEGLLWIATDGGVAVFDGKDRWDVFAKGKVLPDCMCQNIVTDKSGNVWVGTDSHGLLRLSDYHMADPAEDVAADSMTTAPQQTMSNDNANKETPVDINSPENRIKVTPYLAEGYITISMNCAQAEVTFFNVAGEKVRTIPKYKNGGHLSITKMPRGKYTIQVKTPQGIRNAQITLK